MGVVFEGAIIGQTDFRGAFEFMNGSFGFAADCVDLSGGMHHVVEMVHTAFRYGGFLGKFSGAVEIFSARLNFPSEAKIKPSQAVSCGSPEIICWARRRSSRALARLPK